jgi:hypothetical protein
VSDDTTVPPGAVAVELQVLKAFQFYERNYTPLVLAALGSENKRIVLGTKPCRFCGGKEPVKTLRKRAHAVSELLGNKIMVSLYECDDCNKRLELAFERRGAAANANLRLGQSFGSAEIVCVRKNKIIPAHRPWRTAIADINEHVAPGRYLGSSTGPVANWGNNAH